MERALVSFLDALGAMSPRERRQAARMAAESWAGELAFGETVTDLTALIRPMKIRGKLPELVHVDDIDVASVCPHHLLPMRGVVRLAYVPSETIAPLGHLTRMAQTAAARLIVQEELAEQIVDALMGALGAEGAACVVAGSHDCMQIRGRRTRRARVSVLAVRGCLVRGPRRKEVARLLGAKA